MNYSVTGYNPYMNYGSFPLNNRVTTRNVAFINQPDTVSLSSNNQTSATKTELSKNAKLGLGALALMGIGAAAYILSRGKVGNKSVQQLAEHIEFQPAKTIEEAIQFGTTHLNIKEYKGFQTKDIDVINWINEGIVNISNSVKGKSKIPKKIIYKTLDEHTRLEVNSEGVLRINKSVFDNLDNTINNYLNDGSCITFKDGKFSLPDIYSISTLKELLRKLYKFVNNPSQCDFKEKVELFENLQNITGETNSFFSNPMNRIKAILNNLEAKNKISQIGLESNIDNIAKMSIDEQQDLLLKYIREANIKKSVELTSRFTSIYHEFGHLNDPNLSSRANLKRFYDKNKKTYPAELKEWINNIEKQKIAGEVSSYAQENPAEFIAETYAKLIEGHKVSDDVITLYKSYGGPALS